MTWHQANATHAPALTMGCSGYQDDKVSGAVASRKAFDGAEPTQLLGRGYQGPAVTESRWWHFATSWELEIPTLGERRQ